MTQCDRLINYMNEFGWVDPMTSWAELGIYRLASRICDIKKMGYKIEKGKKDVINRFGETVTVSKYRIVESVGNEVLR